MNVKFELIKYALVSGGADGLLLQPEKALVNQIIKNLPGNMYGVAFEGVVLVAL